MLSNIMLANISYKFGKRIQFKNNKTKVRRKAA